ncbi:hypothetical protein GALMADRAFT_208903 [Galerina marginata CBS 339.88]|uniref:Uncharacterized protein n=1 Tax=Galerina marginata (strain CBS 339.88) TaxID=685588 RepID=A0A067TKU4_GALM3|nr:hypothetical protein GALMADRAFT_208903 [Galerina marginata CBS 339.88]
MPVSCPRSRTRSIHLSRRDLHTPAQLHKQGVRTNLMYLSLHGFPSGLGTPPDAFRRQEKSRGARRKAGLETAQAPLGPLKIVLMLMLMPDSKSRSRMKKQGTKNTKPDEGWDEAAAAAGTPTSTNATSPRTRPISTANHTGTVAQAAAEFPPSTHSTLPAVFVVVVVGVVVTSTIRPYSFSSTQARPNTGATATTPAGAASVRSALSQSDLSPRMMQANSRKLKKEKEKACQAS